MKKTIGTFLLFSVTYIIFNSGAAFAASGIVMDKAYMEGVHTCYTGSDSNGPYIRTGNGASSPITMGDFPVFPTWSISDTSNSKSDNNVIFGNDKDGIVLLPSNLAGLNDDDLSCNELFVGYNGLGGKFDGILNIKNITRPGSNASPSEKTDFMTKLGYNAVNANATSGVCSSIVLNKTTKLNGVEVPSQRTRTNSICGKNLDDGAITSNSLVSLNGNDGGADVVKFSLDKGRLDGKILTVSYFTRVREQTNLRPGDMVNKKISESFNLSDYPTWNKFVEAIAQSFANKTLGSCTTGGGDGGSYSSCTTYTVPTNDYYTVNPTKDTQAVFKIANTQLAANLAIKNLSTDGLTGYHSLEYTSAEKARLYQEYLEDIFEIEFEDKSCPEVSESSEGMILAKGYIKTRWNFGDGARTCYVKSAKESTVDSVNGIKENNHFGEKIVSDEKGTVFRKLLEELDSIKLKDGEFDENALKSDDNNVDCLSSGAAENLGWIVCPILDFATTVSEELYNGLIVPALKVEPKLFQGKDGENNDAYDAWSTFQGFANIIFIIFFLFVIFSQVTGVGIDNYGVKKIMPKLIVTAILINLSYVICQACVDLSNIVGNGIQELFNSLANNLTISGSMEGTDVGAAAGSTMLSAVGIAAAVSALWATKALWILPLLIGAIGALISILFLFLLLAGREALVVLLTVISPLAFVCYLLPNTKKLFDKYVKIGEVMLLLYPICGLMVAGGGFVSKLLLSVQEGEQGLFSTFAAMAISIVPIFFIPKVVKSSFGALGSVGATLSGLGDRLSGRAKSGAKNSGLYKAGQERLNMYNTKKRAGIGKDGKPIDLTGKSKLWRAAHGIYGNKSVAKARAQYLKDQDTKARADRLTSGVGFGAAQIAQEKAIESDRVKDYMAYINSETNNGENEKRFNELVGQYANGGDKYGVAAAARIAGRRKDTADTFLKNHFTENKKQYSKEMRNALAKEIATGENSGNYMASAPLGFEYASQLNKGTPSAASAGNYSEWLKDKNNIHDALDHYVTNSSQLVGLKNSSLENIYKLANSGQMNEADIAAISKLAYDTKANKDKTGVWDRTKADVIDKLIELRHPDPGETFTDEGGI